MKSEDFFQCELESPLWPLSDGCVVLSFGVGPGGDLSLLGARKAPD